MYHIAHTSLSVSVSWLEELVRYIDDTYSEYVDSKFSAKKAWNVTTRLAKTLLSSISQPRNGLSKSFRTRKPWQIKNAIFYSSLKSLDLMQKISQGGFKNSPIVAHELVKFLSKNTNMEAIEHLKSEVKDLKEELRKLKSSLSDTNSKLNSVQSMTNSVNTNSATNKSSINDLKGKVKKLEDKVF